jgi:hypothetical protein
MINSWTVLFFFFVILDFITDNGYREFLGFISVIYIALLAAYVGHKEFSRWYNYHQSQHPGEIFVALWSILFFSLVILDFIFKKPYILPDSVVSAFIAVLTILAITAQSKQLFRISQDRIKAINKKYAKQKKRKS